jgi:hypothetical protein
VAFYSFATNLVAGDTKNVIDVFMRDRSTGLTQRVSVTPGGIQADNASYEPAISADGGHAAFISVATNLVAGDTNNFGDIFVHDLFD